jgi:hypothetical protein
MARYRFKFYLARKKKESIYPTIIERSMPVRVFICLILLLAAACQQRSAVMPEDAGRYTGLGKGFYMGPDGNMYIVTAGIDAEGVGGQFGSPFFREVPPVDVASFINLGASGWYARDKEHVYIDHFMSDGRHLWLLDEADAATFEVIGYRWGRDKDHVFENGIILEGLHPDSMVVLCPDTSEFGEVFIRMVKDNHNVFWGNMRMDGADAASFECIRTGSSVVYRDKNWLYLSDYFPNCEPRNRRKR